MKRKIALILAPLAPLAIAGPLLGATAVPAAATASASVVAAAPGTWYHGAAPSTWYHG